MILQQPFFFFNITLSSFESISDYFPSFPILLCTEIRIKIDIVIILNLQTTQ